MKLFKRKRKVLVINPHVTQPEDFKRLISYTRLPVVRDASIKHSFEVKAVE